ncbi:MAG: UPF0262 family protein [Geminicoccaceae bacterium]|nr:UPF0262 family protein [Geminicoccaceae bacterium]MCB9943449.1 UPF0262 family protein [Geminicoccaceae bacterium]
MSDASRITDIRLDERSIVRWSPEIEHERDVAIFDLLEDNHFQVRSDLQGPFELLLSLRETTLIMDVTGAANDNGTRQHVEIALSVRPLRRIIKDYFMICESYFDAIKGATPSRIEAIDMARRGLHNEGSDVLKDALVDKVGLDDNTARRLFTLVCVLHLRG